MPSPLCCPALPRKIAETETKTWCCFRRVNWVCLYEVSPTYLFGIPEYNFIAKTNRSRPRGNTKTRLSRHLGHSCAAPFPAAAYLRLNNQRSRVSTAYTRIFRTSGGRTPLGDTCTLAPGGRRDNDNGDERFDMKGMGLKTREDLKPL